jgi:electron transfer flavoprotein beta subunit
MLRRSLRERAAGHPEDDVAMNGELRIAVCVRRALDWNISTKDFRIDAATGEPVLTFARYRIDQFDEIALELALQAKESSRAAVASSRAAVHALTAGAAANEDVLKHALAMGADAATLSLAEAMAPGAAPALLAAAARRANAQLVLCGRSGSERGTGTTGPLLAEMLGVPLVTNVVRLTQGGNGWTCEREHGAGYQRVELAGPFVATVTNAPSNVPRQPSLKDKMRAHRQAIEVLDAQALGSPADGAGSAVADLELVRRYVPQLSRQCRRVAGEVHEQAQLVAQYIASALEAQR